MRRAIIVSEGGLYVDGKRIVETKQLNKKEQKPLEKQSKTNEGKKQ